MQSGQKDASTVKTSEHTPCSVAYKLSSFLPGYDEQVKCHFGPDCMDKFLDDLDALHERLEPVMKMNMPREKLDDASMERL